ncbi:MAG: Long-chain-fatty-acid--CoA ligase [Phycisphaerales bacterium]|nr:Long-chain-fatty-acid--CoA ligase [Phycisphaerales bacterium]
MSIHWSILRKLVGSPGRVAMIDERRSYRNVELLVAAFHAAAAINQVCRSRTLGVMIPTSGAFPIAALAGWILGKVVVPLNFLLTREELQYVIDDCGCDTVVSATPLLDHMGYEPTVPNLLRIDQMSFAGMPEVRWPAQASDDDLAVLLYTSGTSGRPKGVMLTHGNICANMEQIQDWVEFTHRDVMLGVLPQFHTFGLTVLTLLPLRGGIRVVFAPRFVPGRIIKLLREHRPTVMVAIPSMYAALLHAKDATAEDFSSLRYVVSGGEPLPAAVFEKFRERFKVTINEGYGLTETSPVTNWCRPGEWRPHSVGRPIPRVVERIVDPATLIDLPTGTDGEVWIGGPNVMRGYYKLPEETARALTPDGFLRTGDMGRLDADGHLYITGRIKEMLIIGGENVFPREIEEVIKQHPSVVDAGVVGKPDPLRGELPVAFVELHEGAAFDERALLTWLRERLAGYKVPDEIRHLASLPRNPTGKVMRRELKKLLG